jgi:hypothetical protein
MYARFAWAMVEEVEVRLYDDVESVFAFMFGGGLVSPGGVVGILRGKGGKCCC